MNEDDSEQMRNHLIQMGFDSTNDDLDANIIILNTCSVRDKPEQKAKSKLGELKKLKNDNNELIIIFCGCMAQRTGNAIRKSMPFIDIVMGTGDITQLPELINKVKTNKTRITSVDLCSTDETNGVSHIKRVHTSPDLKTFVPIMYGCNNYCSYCIVPYTRGSERSRMPAEIIFEIIDLVENGCREVTLVGQNVNSYGNTLVETIDFASLLYKINDIPKLERIRFMTSHPKDLSDQLIDAIKILPKVCEHLHLPIQSGDDEILNLMGRKYTTDHYKYLIDKVRNKIPEISITSDIMVGFPGERDKNHQNTMKIVEEIKFDGAFMFAYNARPGTVAANMSNQIEYKIKNQRLRELIALQNDITYANNKKFEGSIQEVLVESTSDKDKEKSVGQTRTNKTAIFPCSDVFKGQTINILIKKAHPWGFDGEPVPNDY